MKGYFFVIIGLVIVTLFLVFSILKFFKVKANNKLTTRQITKDAIMLALLVVTGMLSLPLGDNIKVSLQLLTLLIIFGLADTLFDAILIPSLYLLLGLFMPIYAGFQAGITPTFGFVIAFVFAAIPFHLIYKNIKINFYLRFIISALSALIIVYIGGTIFFMFYLNQSLPVSLMITVVPYIPFDVAKIILALLVVKFIPKEMKPSFLSR